MFVGLERGKKGPLYAAKAYALVAQKHKNLELHVIGDGRTALPSRNCFPAQGCLTDAFFHGYIPLESYYAVLGHMDIVMAPS